MQQTMLRWIEAADARTALDHPTIIIVPRKSGVAAIGRLANLAMLFGTMLAVLGR
jgi:hypothetical protein